MNVKVSCESHLAVRQRPRRMQCYVALSYNIKVKGKCIYIAHFYVVAHSQGAQAWITLTVLPADYTNACLYLVIVHQMAPPQTEVADI